MGNFWSEPSESLISVRSYFLNIPTVDVFKDLEDRLTWCDRYKLGYEYKVWHTTCLYYFMITKHTNLISDKLICDFLEIEKEVIDGFENAEEWAIYPMLILQRIIKKKKYNQIIEDSNNHDYKTKVNRILSDNLI